MHSDTGDIIVTVDMIEDYTQVPSATQHNEPIPFDEYMTIMGARCVEQDVGSRLVKRFAMSIALDDGSNATY